MLVILDTSQRFSIARNSAQSDTTIEVSLQPRYRTQTHYFFHVLRTTARDSVVSSYPQVASTFGVCASRTSFRRYPPNRLASPVLCALNGNFRLLSTRNRGDYVPIPVFSPHPLHSGKVRSVRTVCQPASLQQSCAVLAKRFLPVSSLNFSANPSQVT